MKTFFRLFLCFLSLVFSSNVLAAEYVDGVEQGGGSANVEDDAYDASWNGDSTKTPSRNVVYDWGHVFDDDDDGKIEWFYAIDGTTKVYICGALTGGGSNALDSIASAGLSNAYIAITVIENAASSITYLHVYDSDSSASESSPNVIAPNDIGGSNGRWVGAAFGLDFNDDVGLADTKAITTENDDSDDYAALEATDEVGGTPAQREVLKWTNASPGDAPQIEVGGPTSAAKFYINIAADNLADDSWSGLAYRGGNCGENLTQWDAVYIKNDSDIWHQADATAGSGEYPAQGLVVAACTDTNEAIVLYKGRARHDGWNWTVENPIYLGESDGALTQTAPSTANDCDQIVGWPISDDEAIFDFSRPYQLVE